MANEIQKYTFSAVPSAGSWKPVYDSEPGTAVTDVSIAGDLALALAAISAISSGSNVSVSGNYTSGFTVEFVGALANTDMLTLSHQDNALTIGNTDLGVNIVQEGGGGNNERQDIGFTADGGTVTISWSGYGSTSALAYDADTAAVQSALDSVFGSGNATVSVVGQGNWIINFGSSLADTDIPTPTFTNNLTIAVTISVSVLQEGSPAPSSNPVVSLTASTASVAENGGTVNIIALLDATASATVDVVVGFAGAASTGSDYTLSTTTISIASGQTSGSLTATAINDSVYEGDEAFTASITSVTGGGASASSTASTSVVTIVDDESAPVVTLAGPTFATSSEDASTSRSIFSLTLNNASYQDVTVGIGFSGTATLNVDYTASTNSVVISAGGTSGSFSISRLSDILYEGTETVIVGIDSVTNGTANSTRSSGSATILDSDSAPTVNLSASTTSIVENIGTAYVVASLDIASVLATTIGFGFSGSATINTDYSASSNSLIIAAGNTSGSISITSIQDSSYEGNETIIVGITSVTNGSAGATNSLSITLVDDDSAPLASPTVSLSASQTSIDENGGSAIIRALLSATHSATVTVTLGIGGTATNTVDYTRTTDAISIASGQTSGSIGITSIQDTIGEGNETVVFSIASVTSGVSASTDSVTITIVDEGVVTNEVGMESTNRPRIAPNAPLIDAVVSCGVVTDWIDICTAPETADNGGSTVVDPGLITRTDQKWKALCSLGTQLLVRLKYDAGVTSPTSPAVQLFGMDANGTINQLVDGSGTHTQTLTIDLTNDVTDGTFKYTTAKTLNIAGCKDVLAAIKTAFAGTGTVNNSTIQARVI